MGRTGAGKSSIVAAILRMTEPEGSITIDSMNTKDIGLTDLRSKITTIPQVNITIIIMAGSIL